MESILNVKSSKRVREKAAQVSQKGTDRHSRMWRRA